tara:strand:+ start:186 stop:542 length:357 start_codon:yes stop_codon:yes gene_type:complete
MRPITFGSDTIRMKEVPAGAEAIFRFKELPEIVETEQYGEKYSFPITLHSHPSHPLLEDGPIDVVWESKSGCARELYNAIHNEGDDKKWKEIVLKAYNKSKWKLVRFDSGQYKIWMME